MIVGYINPIPLFHTMQYHERIRNQMARPYQIQSIHPIKMESSFQKMLDKKLQSAKKKKQSSSAMTEKEQDMRNKIDLRL
ncbi:hypothetical protein [Bacillus smithii]|jgi:hypothetical protein|uniref:hypothetical protein n=1 Tax=Bacillus smithii TaxID=1479 RepID=UPI0030CA0D3B